MTNSPLLYSLIDGSHLNTAVFSSRFIIYHSKECKKKTTTWICTNVIGVYSRLRPVQLLRLLEICSVIFVKSCWETSKTANKWTPVETKRSPCTYVWLDFQNKSVLPQCLHCMTHWGSWTVIMVVRMNPRYNEMLHNLSSF